MRAFIFIFFVVVSAPMAFAANDHRDCIDSLSKIYESTSDLLDVSVELLESNTNDPEALAALNGVREDLIKANTALSSLASSVADFCEAMR